jgi:hypothetical protein
LSSSPTEDKNPYRSGGGYLKTANLIENDAKIYNCQPITPGGGYLKTNNLIKMTPKLAIMYFQGFTGGSM